MRDVARLRPAQWLLWMVAVAGGCILDWERDDGSSQAGDPGSSNASSGTGAAGGCEPDDPTCTLDCQGLTCSVACPDDRPCDATCSGPSDCTIDCGSSKSCTVKCTAASCNVDCGSAESCTVSCSTGNCQVECGTGACRLECSASNGTVACGSGPCCFTNSLGECCSESGSCPGATSCS